MSALSAETHATPKLEPVLDARFPRGRFEQKWDRSASEMKLVNPANRRKHTNHHRRPRARGAAAAATLGEQGTTCVASRFTDTPAAPTRSRRADQRRQDYRNDAKRSRLFKDHIKGGDFRAREANAYAWRSAVRHHRPVRRPGVPFARDNGGSSRPRSRRRAGRATFYARARRASSSYRALPKALGAADRRAP